METFKEYWITEGDDEISPEVAAERVWDFKEKQLIAAQRLCKIYFALAAETIGEDEVRRKRDEALKKQAHNDLGITCAETME